MTNNSLENTYKNSKLNSIYTHYSVNIVSFFSFQIWISARKPVIDPVTRKPSRKPTSTRKPDDSSFNKKSRSLRKHLLRQKHENERLLLFQIPKPSTKRKQGRGSTAVLYHVRHNCHLVHNDLSENRLTESHISRNFRLQNNGNQISANVSKFQNSETRKSKVSKIKISSENQKSNFNDIYTIRTYIPSDLPRENVCRESQI